MLDDLRQMAIFAKTVDHGSFRAAAKALRLSPSVVSHHVGQLEQRLGTALLYRSTRRLSLTPDGERLLVAAHIMIDAAESGVQEIANHTNQPTGTLRLTFPALLAQSKLTDKIAEFTLAYPQVQFSVDCSDVRRDLISDGYDVAVRAGELKDSSLKARKLFEFGRRLVASPRYLKTRPKPTSPSDLSDWDWLELAPVWHKKREFRKGTKRVLVTKRKPRISVNSASALQKLARAGAGLAVIPEFLGDTDIAEKSLRYVLPDWTVDPVQVFAVWPPNAPKDGLVKHFIEFLGEAASE